MQSQYIQFHKIKILKKLKTATKIYNQLMQRQKSYLDYSRTQEQKIRFSNLKQNQVNQQSVHFKINKAQAIHLLIQKTHRLRIIESLHYKYSKIPPTQASTTRGLQKCFLKARLLKSWTNTSQFKYSSKVSSSTISNVGC